MDALVQANPTMIQELSSKKIKKISCGEYFGVALDENGKLYSWGNGNDG